MPPNRPLPSLASSSPAVREDVPQHLAREVQNRGAALMHFCADEALAEEMGADVSL
jgi:hypothetical protein